MNDQLYIASPVVGSTFFYLSNSFRLTGGKLTNRLTFLLLSCDQTFCDFDLTFPVDQYPISSKSLNFVLLKENEPNFGSNEQNVGSQDDNC